MRRVVVTGMGVVSCLGNDPDSVSRSLAEGRSGIRAAPRYAELGMRSQVAGIPQIELEAAARSPRLALHGRRRRLRRGVHEAGH